MKILIELIKIIATSVVVALLILLATKSYQFHCAPLDAFISQSGIFSFFKVMEWFVVAIVIWLIGVITYFIIKRKRTINILLYFSILTTIAFYSFIINAIKREPETNRELKEVICSKGSGDEMKCTFKALTTDEYNFINSEINHWLPLIPENTDSINIDYFHDDFFGDFRITIEMFIPPGEELDTLKFDKWKKYKNYYLFEDSQS